MGSEVSFSGKTTDASPQPLTAQCAWLPHGGPWEPGARRAGDSASRTPPRQPWGRAPTSGGCQLEFLRCRQKRLPGKPESETTSLTSVVQESHECIFL